MIKYKIYDLGNGWFDFKDIPQGYIKIHGLNCGSEEKAIARATKMVNSMLKVEFEIVKA